MQVRKEPEGVQEHDPEGRQSQRDELECPRGRRSAIPTRPTTIQINGRGNQRDSWSRRRASCAFRPVRERVDEHVPLRLDRAETRPLRGVVEHEVPVRRRGPHLTNALVRARDPDHLPCRDRLSLGGRREAARGLWLRGRCARGSDPQPEMRLRELGLRRFRARPTRTPGCSRIALDAGVAEHAVVGVPAEHLVREDERSSWTRKLPLRKSSSRVTRYDL